MTVTPEQDFVLKTIKSRDVHFVRFWFTDVLGRMKSFAVIPSELEDAFADGMGFDGSCIEGFCRTQESDMLAFPDASTFQVLPWRPESNAVARMFCGLRTPDGTPFEGDPRQVLARTVEKAQEMGYAFNVGPELEFYYFKDAEGTEVLDRGGYFDLTSLDYASDLRRDTVYASFMPKPMAGEPGSGMHVHQSLYDLDGNNAFYDPDDPQGYRLSKVAKRYLAGLLKYAPEFCAITNQHVNSYKRLIAGGEAPIYLSWARSNRSTLVRVPGYRPASEGACRLELRSPDPSANPYLAFAVMLAAGLAGIEEELELQEPNEDQDLFMLSRQDLRQQGIATLPESLGEAVELFAESELMRATLGDHIHSYLVAAKRAEWNDYQGYVSQWERDRYLAVL